MNIKQENQLSMLITARDYVLQYPTITSPLPNFSANCTTFVNTILLIQGISEQQKISKKGVTGNKNQLKEALIVTTFDYTRKLGAYAKFTNNAVLAQEINFSMSKLHQAADTAVKDFAQIVYDRAQSNISSLATYGITAATQTSLLSAITAYNAVIGKPGVSRSETSQMTKQLIALFKTAHDALACMDAAVEIVRLTQVNFYNGYKAARKVINNGGSSLSVKGLVTDNATGKPVKGVTVSFALNGGGAMKVINDSETTVVVKKSAEKGGFNVKAFASGIYHVTLKKVGYADQVVSVVVNDGEMSVMDVKIDKN